MNVVDVDININFATWNGEWLQFWVAASCWKDGEVRYWSNIWPCTYILLLCICEGPSSRVVLWLQCKLHGFFDVNIKIFDASIDLPQADGTNEEGGSSPNHQNYLRGMRCLHSVNTKLLAASVPLTLENALAVGTFHTDAGGRISTAGLTAAVKRLVPAAQGNWFITIASQVKLWAPQHHQDIGSATAHPNLWERSRFDTYIHLWGYILTLTSNKGSTSCAGTKQRSREQKVCVICLTRAPIRTHNQKHSPVGLANPHTEPHTTAHQCIDTNVRFLFDFSIKFYQNSWYKSWHKCQQVPAHVWF